MSLNLYKALVRLLFCFASVSICGNAYAEEQGCGMYPEAVYSHVGGGGWSGCGVKAAGEKPIWKGLPPDTKQIMRFVFTEGHSSFFRVITVTEKFDGTSTIAVRGNEGRYNREVGDIPARSWRKKLSAEEMKTIDQLGEKSGAWDFEIGSWDGDDMYVHCQFLEIERINAAGYRYSSVNIGCNQPKKLMPLINKIARLAKLKTAYNGGLYY